MTERPEVDGELIREIYRSSLTTEEWPRVLARLTSEFDSTYSVIMEQERATGLARVAATDVLPADRQRDYERHYSRLTPVLAHWDALGEGKIFTDRIYGDSGDYRNSEIYNDFFRPLEADHLMFLELRCDSAWDRCLVLRRSRRIGAYDERTIARFQLLSEHLWNANHLGTRLCIAEKRANHIGAVLDDLKITGFVADASGRVRHVTEQGEQLLREGRVLSVRGGSLGSPEPGFEKLLRAAIRDCATSFDQPKAEVRRVLQAPTGHDRRWPLIAFVSAILWTDAAGRDLPAALIVVNDLRRAAHPDAGIIARLFGLTPAESAVAAALCVGVSPSRYAVATGISVQTARTHLKRVQAKTDTHSQAELVALLLRSGLGNTSR
jgi:DNA-binding CsgD family transcriptional regulator